MRMSAIRLVAGAMLFLLPLALSGAEKNKGKDGWYPIPPEEQALKEHPAEKGAGALMLYKEDVVDQDHRTEGVYRRIKILNESGRKYASLEIPYIQGRTKIVGLRARTIGLDGKAVEFQGKVFEKDILRGRGLKYRAKILTLPNVQPGSIIEYQYTMEYKSGGKRPKGAEAQIRLEHQHGYTWDMEEDLWVQKAHLKFRPYGRTLRFAPRLQGFSNGLPKSQIKIQPYDYRNSQLVADAYDIPPTVSEPYLPPPAFIRSRIEIYYHFHSLYPTRSWKAVGVKLSEGVEKFAGKSRAIESLARQLAPPGEPTETRVRKLYDFVVTQIKNLNYAEIETAKKARGAKEKYRENKNLNELLKNGYGYGWQINRLFVAFLKSAGIEACVARVCRRDRNIFRGNLISLDQLDAHNVAVKIDGRWKFFDPATRFCPFGRIPWPETGVKALLLRGKESGFVTVPLDRPEDNLTRRRILLKIDPDGSATAKVRVTVKGQRTIPFRNRYVELDENQREKRMEEFIHSRTPNARFSNLRFSNLERYDKDLEYEYELEIPNYATLTGRRLFLVPALLNQTTQSRFPSVTRKHDVYFHYPHVEEDEVELELPEGYELEGVYSPQSQRMFLGNFSWELKQEGDRPILRRKLQIDHMTIPVENYVYVKRFFERVYAADKTQIILRKQ